MPWMPYTLGYTLSKLQTAKKQMWVCYNHCMKQYSSTVQVGLALKMVYAWKNKAMKNQPRNTIRDENHPFGIVLVHLTLYQALNAIYQPCIQFTVLFICWLSSI